MAKHYTSFIILTMRIYQCLSLFIEGTSKLPRANNAMAIGYDSITDTILLFGGHLPRQFVTFKDHAFTDHGQSYLTKSEQADAWSQHYTQIGNELWFIQDSGTRFVFVNTVVQPYDPSLPDITIPIDVDDAGCLSSIDGYLIVVGGGSAIKNTQIYRFSDGQWLNGVPSLTTKRTSLSCTVVGDTLYAIGGDDGNTYLDSIETLDISNIDAISTQNWDNTWAKRLISARKGCNAVIYGTDIYVIGGKDNAGNRLNDINVIDTLTGNVAIGDTLAYRTSYGTSTIVGNTLYSFGGYEGGWLDLYQYSILPPLPTTTTSINPTSTPSSHPTLAPSILPTCTPSSEETDDTLNESPFLSKSVMMITTVALLIIFVIIVAFCFYICFKKREQKKHEENLKDMPSAPTHPSNNVDDAMTVEGEPDMRDRGYTNQLAEGCEINERGQRVDDDDVEFMTKVTPPPLMIVKRESTHSDDSDNMYIKEDKNDNDHRDIDTAKDHSSQNKQVEDTRGAGDIYYDQYHDQVFEKERKNQ